MPIELTQPIQITKPVTIAQVTEYDSLWITNISIVGTPTSQTKVEATFAPWSSSTNEIAEENHITLTIDDLFTKAANDHELANAVSVIIGELTRQLRLSGRLP